MKVTFYHTASLYIYCRTGVKHSKRHQFKCSQFKICHTCPPPHSNSIMYGMSASNMHRLQSAQNSLTDVVLPSLRHLLASERLTLASCSLPNAVQNRYTYL